MANPKRTKQGIDLFTYKYFFILTSVIVLLDQATKYLVERALPVNTGQVLISGLLNLVHVRNTGGAFSIFAGAASPWRLPIFIALTLLVLVIIAYAYGKVPTEDRWNRTAYICICGGAAGTLIDRLRLGEVIDFVDIYVGSWHWPAFNVADSAISTGAVMLLISLVRGR
ncbi:MAG: signal peptidase II [Syntrophobacteraceae bacterium]